MSKAQREAKRRRRIRETVRTFEYAANIMSLPALPEAWPDWMTKEKRLEMAANLRRYAVELTARISPPQQDTASGGGEVMD